MYCFTTSSGAPPHEPAKYDQDQSTAFPYASHKSRNSLRRRLDIPVCQQIQNKTAQAGSSSAEIKPYSQIQSQQEKAEAKNPTPALTVTTEISKNHAMIIIEDLKVSNMSKSAKGTVMQHGHNVRAK